MIDYFNGIPVMLSKCNGDPVTIQARVHKSKRINKKWKKRYGFKTHYISNGKAFMFNNCLFIHPKDWKALKAKLEETNGMA